MTLTINHEGHKMKRNEEKINEWRALLEEKKARELTIKAFCQEKNITPAQFYYYQAIIKNPNKSQDKWQKQKTNKTEIKPIQIINSTVKENSLRFILPNSLQCILPRDMAVDEIKKTLELVLSC